MKSLRRLKIPEPPKFYENAICIECGKPGFCIKDPGDVGQKKCRQCYSGLTPEEFKTRLGKVLSKAVGKKKPKEDGLIINSNNEYKRKEFLRKQAQKLKEDMEIPF